MSGMGGPAPSPPAPPPAFYELLGDSPSPGSTLLEQASPRAGISKLSSGHKLRFGFRAPAPHSRMGGEDEAGALRRRVLNLLRGGKHGKGAKGRSMALLRREDVVDSWRRAGVPERERHARVSGALAQACYQSNLKLLMGTLVQQKLGLQSQDAFELLEASEFTNVDGASVSPNEAMLEDPDLFVDLLERHVPGLLSAPRLLSEAEKRRAFGGMRCATWRDLEHAVGSLFEQAIISLHVERAERGASAQAQAFIRELDAEEPAAKGSARSKRRSRRRKKVKQAKQARMNAARAGDAGKRGAGGAGGSDGDPESVPRPPAGQEAEVGRDPLPAERAEGEGGRGPASARSRSQAPPRDSAEQAAAPARCPAPGAPSAEEAGAGGPDLSPAPPLERGEDSPPGQGRVLGTPPRITALVDLDRRPLLLDLARHQRAPPRSRDMSPKAHSAQWAGGAARDARFPWSSSPSASALGDEHSRLCEGAGAGLGDGGAESEDSDWSLWSDSSAEYGGWGSDDGSGEEGEEGEGDGLARAMKRRMREEANRCKQQLRATYVRSAARLSYELDGNDMPDWAPEPPAAQQQLDKQRRESRRRRRRRDRRHGQAAVERHALDNVLADRRSVVMRWEAAHALRGRVAAVAGWPVGWQDPHRLAGAAPLTASAAHPGGWWEPSTGWWDATGRGRHAGSTAPDEAYGAGAAYLVEMLSARGQYGQEGGWVESAGAQWDRGPVPIWRSRGGAPAEEGGGAPLGPRRNLSAHAEPYVPRWAGDRGAGSQR